MNLEWDKKSVFPLNFFQEKFIYSSEPLLLNAYKLTKIYIGNLIVNNHFKGIYFLSEVTLAESVYLEI